MKRQKLSKTTAVVAAALLSVAAMAVPPRLSTPGNDRPYAIEVDSASGAVYVAGTAWVGAGPGNDICLAKYSPTGVLLWTRFFGAAGSDCAYDIGISGGNIYVVGEFQAAPAATTNAIVLCYSPAGALVASNTIATPWNDLARLVRFDPVGNVYVAGYSSAAGADKDILLAKFSPGLALMYGVTWAGPAGDDDVSCMSVGLTGVYIGGTATNGAGNTDGVVLRYNLGGAFLSNLVVSGVAGGNDSVNDLVVWGAGQVFAAATQTSAAFGDQVRIIKTDPTLTFGLFPAPCTLNLSPGAGKDRVNRMIRSAGGNLLIGGRSWAVVGVGYDAFVAAINPATGALMAAPWLFNFIDHDEVLDMVQAPGGQVYAMMATDGVVGHDYGLARIDAGVTTWFAPYNFVGHDEASAMALSPAGRILVTGASENATPDFDWSTSCYNPTGVPFW